MLNVLEMVAQQAPISASELAKICEINRTVAHRLLATLAKHSYVRRTEQGYLLGPGLARLGRLAESTLKQVAKPFMIRLAQVTGETVVLHGVDGLDAIVIDQVPGGIKHLVRVEHTPGSRHPLCRGASGWALLAYQPEKIVHRFGKLHDCNDDMLARLDQVRTAGYAESHDELQLGVHGIAAPLFGKDGSCEASIAVLVPSVRAAAISGFRQHLLDAATNISRRLAVD
ncbi:IclR family transcriptional regulator [Paraburkholderia sacchari]|uniref:IclR family transcriptional regulator n=1 Tax=Paraburkholderia sacchari TaxID=159450 RepID=UPI0039A60295